jgi:hypothetical protein
MSQLVTRRHHDGSSADLRPATIAIAAAVAKRNSRFQAGWKSESSRQEITRQADHARTGQRKVMACPKP